MSIPRSLFRVTSFARTAIPVLSARGGLVSFARSASSSAPFEPPSPSAGPSKVTRPPLKSLAQIKAEKAVEQHRLDTLRGSGWSQSKEPGQEDQDERIVYSRPAGQSNMLIWAFLASQIVFLVSLIDIQAGTTFLLPAPRAHPPARPAEQPVSSPDTLPDDPPDFKPQAYKTSAARQESYNIPHPDPVAAAAEAEDQYKPPYVAFFGLTVVCIGLPLGLIQGWARSSIVKISSLRPSGRIKIVTRKDELLKWVRKQGTIVETGVASESFAPDGVKVSNFVTLYLPVNGKTLQRKIDLSKPTERELETAEKKKQRLIVDRDLIKQTFEGIQEAA